MKVLLDENLPLDLRHFLAEHEVFTIAFMGWKGLRNGELLRRAETEGFDLLISRDAGIQYQQNLANLPLAVILLPPHANKLEDILPMVPSLLNAMSTIGPRTLLRLVKKP
jgi:predicted nuclease of predicted toxin-antitoxin system